MSIDAQVPLESVNRQTVPLARPPAPFGEGNPQPTFLSTGVWVKDARTVGRDRRSSAPATGQLGGDRVPTG